jgi:nucleoside-diphosphate-sugar epimerase
MAEPASPDTLRDARVLVTGAAGFLGRHLCNRLIELGAEVHGTSRSEQPPVDKLTWHRLDPVQRDDVHDFFDRVRPEVVFHLASVVKGSRDRQLVVPTFEANLASTVYLLDAAAERQCQRFVQIGSLEEPPFDEPSAPPASPYAAAKAAATGYCRMFAKLYGLPVSVARVFMVYGPGPQDIEKLLPYVILELLSGREPELGSGARPVDWIYVDDVVEGLVRLAGTSGLEGQRVDLGSGDLVTIRDVVYRVYELLEREEEPQFGSLSDRPSEQIRKADVEETEELLGWKPAVSLDEGLQRTVEWFRGLLASNAGD